MASIKVDLGNCGKKHCCHEKSYEQCKYLSGENYGLEWRCIIFDKKFDTTSGIKSIERLPECITSEIYNV